MGISTDIIIYTLAILAMALTVIGHIFKRTSLGLSAAFAWILFAVFAYSESGGPWDIEYGMFWFGMGVAIVTALEGLAWRTPKSQKEELEEKTAIDRYLDKAIKYQKQQERFREAMGDKEIIRERRRATQAKRNDNEDITNTRLF